MTEWMKGDAAYDKDINRANTVDEILELSRNARDRGLAANGVTRNPITGQFEAAVRDAAEQDESARAAAAAAAASGATRADGQEYSRVVTIAGKQIEFSNTSPELLERDIQQAQKLAEVWQQPSAEEQEKQAKNARELAAADRAELDRQLRLGIITTSDYLSKSGAVGDYLEAQGISLDALRERSQEEASKAYQQSWANATREFLNGPGATWPGGNKNLAQMQMAVNALGLIDAEDKVAALVQAYEYLKQAGTLFDREVTQAEILKSTQDMTPAEILQAWKEQQPGYAMGDATAANQALINSFRRR